MTHPERHILSTKEAEVGSQLLVATSDNDRVRVEKTVFDDGVERYSVTAREKIHRESIARIMARPLYYLDATWREVLDGLRDIGYPSNQVRRSASNREKRAHLRKVQPATRELAEILKGNQPYFTQSVNIPAYSASESMQYVNKVLLTRESAKRLLTMLKGVGLDAETANSLTQLVYYTEQSEDVVKELVHLTGMSETDLREAENVALFDRVDRKVWLELVHRRQAELFTGFLKTTAFDDGRLQFGSDDPSVFVFDHDIPDTIRHSHRDVAVSLGRKIRSDKKDDEQRYEVTFYSHDDAVAAIPRVVWDVKDGSRSFAFPTSDFERTRTSSVVGRPSSILGAAVVANYARDNQQVFYGSVLSNRLFPPRRYGASRGWGRTRHGAGMLPLVINHHENTVLSSEYFLAIEDALK